MESIRKLSLWTKFNLVIALVLLLFFALAAWLDYRQQQQTVIRDSVEKSRLLAAAAVKTREYVSNQLRDGDVALSRTRYGLIPVVASNRIGQEIGQLVGYQVRQVSNRYRNPANAPDPFEQAALSKFAATPELKEYYAIDRHNGEKVFRYLQSFRADQSCLECHGEPADAPAFLKEAFPVASDQSYHYRLGEIVGAASISIPLHQLDRQVLANLRIDLLHTGGIFVALIVVVGLLLRRTVTRPLAELGKVIATVERTGRFSERLPVRNRDEIGTLTDGFNHMMGELERNVGQIEESEQRFRLLAETAHDSIISFLANGQIILFNRSAERTLGYNQIEAIGMRVDHLIHADCSELAGIPVAELLLRDEARLLQNNSRVFVRHRDGRRLVLEMALSVAESDGHRFYTAFLRET